MFIMHQFDTSKREFQNVIIYMDSYQEKKLG